MQSIYVLIYSILDSTSETNTIPMSKKGSAKNTKNKAIHSKLMAQKKSKKTLGEQLRKEKLKEIIKKAHESKQKSV